MALTLASGISASDRYCTVNQPPTQPPGSYYRIGDEVVQHIGFATPTPIWSQTFLELYVARSQLGTTAVSHLSGTALTFVRPEFLSATAETDPGPFETDGGGGGTGAASVGFAWHWNFGIGQTIAADGVWTSTDAAPTIDFDPQGFFVTDGAIVPTGLGGTYYAQVIARFTSPTATGFVAVDAVGTTFKTRTPVLYDDGTSMFVVWHYMFDMTDGDNLLDVQHFANLTDHDVTLLRVDIRTQRLGSTPA
jgi:hypothetical protein